MKFLIFAILFVTSPVLFQAMEAGKHEDTTKIMDRDAAQTLLGKHRLTLQWISREQPGKISVTNDNGLYYIKGLQTDKGDLLHSKSRHVMKIDGVISEINARSFLFSGTINILLGGRNNNQACIREGTFSFRYREGNSKFWRLKENENPCHDHTDYIDVYVDRNWQPVGEPKINEPGQLDSWEDRFDDRQRQLATWNGYIS